MFAVKTPPEIVKPADASVKAPVSHVPEKMATPLVTVQLSCCVTVPVTKLMEKSLPGHVLPAIVKVVLPRPLNLRTLAAKLTLKVMAEIKVKLPYILIAEFRVERMVGVLVAPVQSMLPYLAISMSTILVPVVNELASNLAVS